jgi:hypothetical protein
MLRPTVNRPVSLCVKPHLVPKTRFFLVSESCGFDVGHPLWREDRSAVYNWCWSSPAQSFSDQSPTGLMTILYSLRFETPPTWRARTMYLYPPRTGRPGYTPRHWVCFSSPPTTRRATAEVFEPPPHGGGRLRCHSQSYFTTGGLPPISSSWRQAPWGSLTEIFFARRVQII